MRLTGLEEQSTEYASAKLNYINNGPLPFVNGSTGELTRFTDYLDPNRRSRPVVSFHLKRPDKKTYTDPRGCQIKHYRSGLLDCRDCPLHSTCIGKSSFKKIEDEVDKVLYDELHQRLQISKARRMKKLRQANVEPVIGTLVSFLGMQRVNTRGIQLANKCLLVAAVCYNGK